jgi:hypothetical protein
MIDWETLKADYLQRFGPLRDLDSARLHGFASDDDLDAPTHESRLLTFQAPDQPGGPSVYASFGALLHGCGQEIFLTAAKPFWAFASLVRDVAATAPRGLSALQIVRAAVRFTPFDAVLVLPEEDGTFPLGEVGGIPRHVFRIVPLTRAERLLGEREPALLLDRLRAAGALVADPFRACVVEPEREGGRRANLAELLKRERLELERWRERLESTRAMNAPDILIEGAEMAVARREATLATLESWVPAVFPEPGAPELRTEDEVALVYRRLFDDVLGSNVEAYAGLVPPRVGELFRAFTFFVVGRHPWVVPITYEAAMGEGRERGNHQVMDPEARLDGFVDSLVAALPHFFPTTDVEEARARGLEVAERAMGTLDPESADPWEVQVWSVTATAIYLDVAPLDPEDRPAVERALREAGDLAARLIVEVGRDAAPAQLRVARIASAISRTLYRRFVRSSPRVTSTGAPLN